MSCLFPDTNIGLLMTYIFYRSPDDAVPFHYSLVYILDIFFWWFFSRAKSAVDVTSEFVDMYIEVPVEEWGKQLEAADIPNLRYIIS